MYIVVHAIPLISYIPIDEVLEYHELTMSCSPDADTLAAGSVDPGSVTQTVNETLQANETNLINLEDQIDRLTDALLSASGG